jgi:ABC-2 type transport system permease protein
MKRLWVIAKKDIRESFRSRSTYLYIVILFVLSFSYFSSYGARMDSVIAQNPSNETVKQASQASQAILNSFASTLPMLFSIWVCTIFATYSVVVEKAKRNLESLMVTPVSLKQIWLGKTLAVTLPSVIIGLGVSIIVYSALNIMKVIPETGSFLFPGPLAIISALILVPLLIFTIVSLVIYLQLTIANPRFANFIFLGIFFLLFFGINALAGFGITTNYALIYLGVAVLCGIVSLLLSPTLTKERVLLSSKEQ